MAWDPVSVIGGTEPLYFGPLAGYDTEELDRRGIDQDKKTTKGFRWMSEAATAKNKSNISNIAREAGLGPRTTFFRTWSRSEVEEVWSR